jgi:hypothetical protein
LPLFTQLPRTPEFSAARTSWWMPSRRLGFRWRAFAEVPRIYATWPIGVLCYPLDTEGAIATQDGGLPSFFPAPLEEGRRGMGLILVQRVVERHNGKIWAESVEGEGSTFFVWLPSVRVGGLG